MMSPRKRRVALVRAKRNLPMSPKAFMEEAGLSWPKLTAYAFLLGVAWATLTSAVREKPTRQEVATELKSLADSMHVGDHLRDQAIQDLAADLKIVATDTRTIRYILCGKASPDSFCHRTP